MTTKVNSSRKKTLDMLDSLFSYYRSLESIGKQFPNLPPELKNNHSTLVRQASEEVQIHMKGN